jgi:hypothetical protein
VGRLGDQHPLLHAHDPARLVEHDLDLPRVAAVAIGELASVRAGDGAGQVDDRALGLGHHLLGDDQDVARVEGERAGRPLERVADDRGQVVADADLGDPLEGQDRDRAVSRHRRPRG